MASYHQSIATRLQSGQADTEEDHGRKGVVVDEAPAVGISMTTVEGQVSIGVAGKQHGAKVYFEGDGLHPTVHTDVPLRCEKRKHALLLQLSCIGYSLISTSSWYCTLSFVNILSRISSPGKRLWKLASQLYPLNCAPTDSALLKSKRIKHICSISAPRED